MLLTAFYFDFAMHSQDIAQLLAPNLLDSIKLV